MVLKMERKLRVSILILIFILISHLSAREAHKLLWAEEDTQDWAIVETQFLTIYYPKEIDIKKINKRIDTRFINVDLPGSLPGERNPEKLLAYKFDLIFTKAETILDMYPRGLHLKVKIYKTLEELGRVSGGISASANRASSFYIHREKTIYTTVRTISPAVLSHEIAHSIIDHYFVILPPRKIQELLASYVETHLED
jgi:hypothetical protein